MKYNFYRSRNVLLSFTLVLLGVFLLKYITEGSLPSVSELQLGIFIAITAIIIILGIWISLSKGDNNSDKKDDSVKTISHPQPLTSIQKFAMVALGLLLAFNVSTLWEEWSSDIKQLTIQIVIYILSILLGLAVGYWAFSYFVSHKKKCSCKDESGTKF